MTQAIQKKKVLFEASILSCFNEKTFGRSGIYFVADELLRQFIKNQEFEITLYCNSEYLNNLRQFAKIYYPDIKVKSQLRSPFCRFFAKQISFLQSVKTNSFFIKILKKSLIYVFRFILKIESFITYIPNFFRFDTYDIFFSPFRKAPGFILHNKKIQKYLMIHDFISAKFPSYMGMKKTWMNIAWSGINKRDKYICISENTKKDLHSLFSFVTEDQIFVNYNGISNRFFESIPKGNEENVLTKYGLKSKTYMFSIGSLVEHKNLKMQIKAFAKFIEQTQNPDFYYVIAGPSIELNNFLEDLGINKEIQKKYKFIGYLEDDEVPVLYHNALWCSFTSLYEGFGIPAIEAMSASCPLVCSNTTSLPEICMNAALLINPKSEDEHIKAYNKLYTEQSLRDELIEKGLKRSKLFTWENSAKGIMNFIDASYTKL